MSRRLRRPALSALLLGLLLGVAGCAYPRDRLLDLTDIIDPKLGTGLGVGAKAELTSYLGLGGGLGVNAWLREWYGRRSYESYGDKFVHFGVFGQDGGLGGVAQDAGVRTRPDTHVTIVNVSAFADHVGRYDVFGYSDAWELPDGYEVPPLGTRWRIGGEFMIPALSFGLYVNLGEIADFVLGLGTIDFRDDDGVCKCDVYSLGMAPEADANDPRPGGEVWRRN